jgi:aspartyl-tRNA(Asn)/glutamyl-tRNA(Gln) amidotransferase subunit C
MFFPPVSQDKEASMIDKAHVKYIAQLARLVVTDHEAGVFAEHIGSVLEYVEKLNAVDTGGIEPTAFVSPQHDALRDDVLHASMSSEKLLQNGPSVINGYFAVPRVIAR